MKVCKFGGSSVANAEQIRKVIDIVTRDSERRIVVVSAPGKRFKGDEKVTDMLIVCASQAIDGADYSEAVERLVARFESIRQALDLDEALTDHVRETVNRRLAVPVETAGKFMDSIMALGEAFSARFCAEAFVRAGHAARFVDPGEAGMLLSDEYGNARLLPESMGRLGAYLAPIEDIVIFPGFFGYTREGAVATFPRGGSDITGAILAAATAADVYENFTDVDSVYPVDPRIVPEARVGITEMTYREMRELSYAGFGVFHDEAVLPAIRARVPINIRNTNRPDEPGTRVVPERQTSSGCIIGLASSVGFGTIFVEKFLMNREVGFVAKLLKILSDEGLPFEHIPTGVDSVSVVLRDSLFRGDRKELILDRIEKELEPDRVVYEPDLALIMVVGEGMRFTVGTCARVVGILSRAGVNIEMINQGASEISMMFGIREPFLEPAVRALYDGLFGDLSTDQGQTP